MGSSNVTYRLGGTVYLHHAEALARHRVPSQRICPAESDRRALELVAKNSASIDAFILDINLQGAFVYPVADALAEPFVFDTEYDASIIPSNCARTEALMAQDVVQKDVVPPPCPIAKLRNLEVNHA